MSLEGWVCEVESEKLSLGKLGLEKESGKLSPEKCMVVGTPPTKIRKRGPYPAGCLLSSLVFPPPCPVGVEIRPQFGWVAMGLGGGVYNSCISG